CVPRLVSQRHEHLALPLAPLVHVVLYDRDPAGISVLVSQPLEDSLRGMLLLGRLTLIFLQDPVDDPDERIQFRPCRWPAPPVSRRHRERQHLRHRPRVDPKPPPASRRLIPSTYTARRTCPYSSTPFIPPPSAHLGRRPSTAGLLLRPGRSIRPPYEGLSLRRSHPENEFAFSSVQ